MINATQEAKSAHTMPPVKEPFIWNDSYSVGVKFIDDQHRELLRILNAFHRVYTRSKDPDELFKTCNQLVTYAENHFRDEEELLRVAGVPETEIAAHAFEHERLCLQIFAANEKLAAKVDRGAAEIKALLENWLVTHILQDDKQYAEVVRNFPDFIPSRLR